MIVYQIVGVVAFLLVAVVFTAFCLASMLSVYVHINARGQWLFQRLFRWTNWAISNKVLYTSLVIAALSVLLSGGWVYSWANALTAHPLSTNSADLGITATTGRTTGQTTQDATAQDATALGRPPAAVPRSSRLKPSSITATSTAPNSQDSSKRTITFAASNMIDGKLDTAWRTAGDGRRVTISVSFPRRVHVTRVGMVPGYAKTDPTSEVDRFTENRRVTSALWSSAGGRIASQTFVDRPAVQTVGVDASVTSLTLTIVRTTASGGKDFTAISEIEIDGYPTP